MYSSTYLKWFRRLLILGAVVAGLTASAAGARLDPGTPPDVSDVAIRLSVAQATDVSRPPDVRDAASVGTATPDVFERYASAHPYGFGAVSSELVSRPPDVRDAASVSTATADVFERYASAHPYGFGTVSSELVSSPPDVQDAASALHVTAQGLKADGLRWNGVAQAYMQIRSGQDSAVVQNTTPEGLQADGLRWQGIAQTYQQAGTSDPVSRILAQEQGRRLDQGLFASSTPSTKVESGGFDWNDYAIGLGSGMGVILLLGAGLTMAIRLQRSHPVQSV
jgi:hypothetical protein